jgi:hypothetical protein
MRSSPLPVWLDIDEEVTAADQVQFGKRRIADRILHGEDHRLAPLRMTQMARSCWSSARERKNKSMGV